MILSPTRRPKGRVALYESLPGWRRGKLLFEADNLFVNAGLPALASLLAGVTTGEYGLAVGFGSSNTAPALTDTDLGATPKYYNAVVSHSFPSSGAVLFNYQIATTDYGATNLTVQEVGLFANTGTISLPDAVGTANPAWAATHTYTLGQLIVDSNGNIQRVTTADTSSGSAPSWSSTIGGTTPDGATLVWTCVALHGIPTPMLAHAVVPSIAMGSPIAAAYLGTWTFTF